MKTTDGLKLKLYEEADNPDLINGYNASMELIETECERLDTAVTDTKNVAETAESTANTAKTTADTANTNATTALNATKALTYTKLTVGELAKGIRVAYKVGSDEPSKIE